VFFGLIGGARYDLGGGAVFLSAIVGGVSGWFVSGLPLYYWRHRFAQFRAAQQFRRLP
jgi:hypothetical protein